MRINIYGRSDSIETIKLAEAALESTMLAVYGRRRIGKTFMIDEYFKDEPTYLFIKNVGIKNEPSENQIKIFFSDVNKEVDKFNKELRAILHCKGELNKFKEVVKEKLSDTTWEEFFSFLSITIDNLQVAIRQNNLERKIVYFFDEVPFVAEQADNFANRLGAIWEKNFNRKRKHLFILCGSAASWMIQEIVNAKGGLNSRCKYKIALKPFNYREMKQYLKEKHQLSLNEKDAVKTYMCIGGVAKYLDFYANKSGLMFNQSISKLMFEDFKDMRNEFDLLMESIFKNATVHKLIIKYLATGEKGYSVKEIVDHLIKNGRNELAIKRAVKELADCDYLLEMPLVLISGEKHVYRLIDEYCRFYFKWIHGLGAENFHATSNYWSSEIHNTKIWFGTSFEVFCFRNKDSIKNLLGLSRFNTSFFSFNIVEKGGAEGDVVVEASLAKKIEGVFIIENKFKEDKKLSINDSQLEGYANKILVLKKIKKYDIDPKIIFITSDGVVENSNLKKISSGSFTIYNL